jgi:hypothetical protein
MYKLVLLTQPTCVSRCCIGSPCLRCTNLSTQIGHSALCPSAMWRSHPSQIKHSPQMPGMGGTTAALLCLFVKARVYFTAQSMQPARMHSHTDALNNGESSCISRLRRWRAGPTSQLNTSMLIVHVPCQGVQFRCPTNLSVCRRGSTMPKPIRLDRKDHVVILHIMIHMMKQYW